MFSNLKWEIESIEVWRVWLPFMWRWSFNVFPVNESENSMIVRMGDVASRWHRWRFELTSKWWKQHSFRQNLRSWLSWLFRVCVGFFEIYQFESIDSQRFIEQNTQRSIEVNQRENGNQLVLGYSHGNWFYADDVFLFGGDDRLDSSERERSKLNSCKKSNETCKRNGNKRRRSNSMHRWKDGPAMTRSISSHSRIRTWMVACI